jgi:hypothetical protein
MFIKKTVTPFFYILITCSLLGLSGCVRPEAEAPAMVEEPPPQALPPAPTQPTARAKLPPPKPAEVQEAIKRVYKGAVTVDANHNAYFTIGDYNGDLSEDIAVIVRPVEANLPDINHELANWMLGDPTKVKLPDPKVVIQREAPRNEPVVIEKGDLLLAIIHGYGETGWRNPEATQTYLLKNAVHGDMKTQPPDGYRKANKENKNRLQLWGDLIGQVFEGNSGFLYYTGAKYAWHGPQSLKGEVASSSTR